MKCTQFGLLALVLSASAIAAPTASIEQFVDRGYFSTDTVGGLDWLDLTATRGETVLAVLSGTYVADGWQIADHLQVAGLFTRYLGATSPINFDIRYQSPADFSSAEVFAGRLGVTQSLNTPSEGFVAADGTGRVMWDSAGFFRHALWGPGFDIYGQVYLQVQLAPQASAVWVLDTAGNPVDVVNESSGTFLVRAATPVPEPASAALVLGGLLVMGIALRAR